jgi:deoxyadenosine/deoxycytidine kinase
MSLFIWISLMLVGLMAIKYHRLLFRIIIARSHNWHGQLIGVEGNISVGKSTLIRTLEKYGFITLPEDVEPGLLGLFYENQFEHAFTLQLNTFYRRSMNILIQRLLHPGRSIIQDRSLIGDLIFGMTHYTCNNMNHRKMAVYLNAAGIGADPKNFRPKGVDKFVYLFANPLRCYQLVQKRGNVDAGIPLSYLTKVHQLHFHTMLYFKANGIDIRFIDWSLFGDARQFIDALAPKFEPMKQNLFINAAGINHAVKLPDGTVDQYLINCSKLDKYEDPDMKNVPEKYLQVIPFDTQQEIVAALSTGKTVHLTNLGCSFVDLFPVMINDVLKAQ